VYTSPEVCVDAAMPFSNPSRDFPPGSNPAPVVEIPDSKTENGQTRCSICHLAAADRLQRLKVSRVESHDMYENAETYVKNTRFVGKRIILITSRLASRLELSQGELKVKAKATMLQKTKEARSCDLVKATMLMKTKDLKFLKPRCL
jgi:hypothetical protein